MLQRVQKVIAEQLGKKPEEITPQSELVKDLRADSIDIMQFIIILENELNVSFEEEALVKLKTVGDIVAFVEKAK